MIASALFLVLVAQSGCATVERFGWVWADQPTAASYTPGSAQQYSSVGTSHAVSRTGPGVYQVSFPGLGSLNNGNVQVTAVGLDYVQCKTAGWQATGANVTADVRCFNQPVGNAADSQFMASFETINKPASDLAYTRYVPPATPMVSVTPDPAWSTNVTSIYTPIHSVILAAPVSGFAMENVTAAGTGAEFCGFSVSRVTCWDVSGVAIDTGFSYVKGLGRVPTSRRGAYAVYDISPGSATSSFTPSRQQSSFSSGSIVVNRVGLGRYEVSIPAGASGGANALVHVTALDLGAVGAPVYCKPASWSAVGPDVAVRVMCYQKSTGQLLPVDDGFQMSYIVPL